MALDLQDRIIVYDNHVAFLGGYLSNGVEYKFTHDDVEWFCSFQYYAAMEAKYFNDEVSYNKILIAKTHGAVAKLECDIIRNFDEWELVKEEKMYEAVYAKFSTSQDLKDLLLSTEYQGKNFVYGSKVDTIWGVGIDFRDPIIDDESKWVGENLLGKILDRVRIELQNNNE